MKHEVFILGRQNCSEEQEGKEERVGEMREGRRERIEKGSRERIIEKREETKREKVGLSSQLSLPLILGNTVRVRN